MVDKSSAYRLADGVPLVVPEVNGARALEHQGIVANPNCCTIPLTCVLKPLEEAARLRRVRVATYQSVSGAGASSRWSGSPASGRTSTTCARTGTSTASSTTRRRSSALETRKIMELPELPISATCVRVPVMVGHAEAVWVETEAAAVGRRTRGRCSAAAPGLRVVDGFPSPGAAAETDDVLVGRIRQDPTEENGLVLFLACDNLLKGAALNAIQIAELLLAAPAIAA